MVRRLLGSTIGLIVTLSLYTVLGSIIFMNLEDGVELASSTSEEDIIDEEITDLIHSLDGNKKNHDLIQWEKTMQAIEHYKVSVKARLAPLSKKHINIWKSLFFCFTIYTSIGYGNIVPDTSSGKLFTCLYAAIGIPLCLLTLDRIGKSVMRVLQWFCENILQMNTKRNESMPIYLCVILMALYMCLGYFVYQRNEKWTSSETLYFLFVTFTTIGFGDVSPDDSKHFVITIAYQFVGLSMMASLINIVASKFEMYVTEETDNKHKSD